MIRAGELLTFALEGKEVRCRIEGVAEDFSQFSVIEQANILRIGKPYNMSITRSDGVISGTGVVESAEKAGEEADEGSGRLEYTVKITKPFQRIQKRNAFRYDCYLEAVLFELNSSAMHRCHLLDLSAGGTRILTNNRFLENKVINIIVTLKEKMHVMGVILGVNDISDRGGEYKYQLRVKFTQLTKREEEAIVQFIFAQYRKTAHKRTGK